MEYDRYKAHHKLYIIGILSLLGCLSLLLFSLYILPYMVWGDYYDVPEFVVSLIAFFEDLKYSSASSHFIVWLLFFLPALICGLISYYVSNYIDDELFDIKPETPEKDNYEKQRLKRLERRESANLSLKILGLMFLIFLAIFLIQLIL
ncbi:MAG: hypothetical protein EPN84_09270 [Legionella sp.]|nr:MAG: hypothetical protein EPN84_09270 [Legionella sp.]